MVALFTRILESIFCYIPWFQSFFDAYYKNIVISEINLAMIDKNDHVLCIGGGPIPTTAINIYKQTGAKVTVVDHCLSAVKLSKKYLRNLRLDDKIDVYYAHGEGIEFSQFSIVHIAKQVTPQTSVLRHVLEKAEIGTKVLVRSPKDKTIVGMDYTTHTNRMVKNTCLLVK